jgi:hypothetical protein
MVLDAINLLWKWLVDISFLSWCLSTLTHEWWVESIREWSAAVQRLLSYLAFKQFDFERKWWRLTQKRVECTTFTFLFDNNTFSYIMVVIFLICCKNQRQSKHNCNILVYRVHLWTSTVTRGWSFSYTLIRLVDQIMQGTIWLVKIAFHRRKPNGYLPQFPFLLFF